MQNHRVVWLLFVTSVWMLITLSTYRSIVHMMYVNDILGAYPGGFGYEVFLAPFLLLAAELFLWFKLFRRARSPGRVFAGIVGAYVLLMVVIVNAQVAEIYDRAMPAMLVWLYVYSSIGHLVYAYFGRECKA